MNCRVSGCTGRTSRWGALCGSHRSRNRRHGDPGQRPITVPDLKPHLQAIRNRIEQNRGEALWPILEDQWAAVVERSKAYVNECERGVTFRRTTRTACAEVTKL